MILDYKPTILKFGVGIIRNKKAQSKSPTKTGWGSNKLHVSDPCNETIGVWLENNTRGPWATSLNLENSSNQY